MKTIRTFIERVEETFLAVTYAEAADLKDLLHVIKNEIELAHPDECQYGDNDLCYLES